jgi:protein gp37
MNHMKNSKIDWTDHTFNPWMGCTKVSTGCANCYAETLMDTRFGRVKWGPEGTRVRTSAAYWKEPLKWNEEAEKRGGSPRVFCGSLCDIGELRTDLIQHRLDLKTLIRRTPNLRWLLLTKRPENIDRLFDSSFFMANRHVALGVSVENQKQADRRIPQLLEIPANMRFLSVEPMLDRISLVNGPYWNFELRYGEGIDWVICGGESGPGARPLHPSWVRHLRTQCNIANTPFFFKQWGEYSPEKVYRNHENRHVFDDGQVVARVGKKVAGDRLDGRTWDQYPEES